MSKIDFDKFTLIFNSLQLEEKIFMHNTYAMYNNIEIFLYPMCDFISWTRRFESNEFVEKLNFINFNSKHNFYTCDKAYNVKSVSDNETLELVNKYCAKVFEDKRTMNYLNDYLEIYMLGI